MNFSYVQFFMILQLVWNASGEWKKAWVYHDNVAGVPYGLMAGGMV
jgi:hypothetical protein